MDGMFWLERAWALAMIVTFYLALAEKCQYKGKNVPGAIVLILGVLGGIIFDVQIPS